MHMEIKKGRGYVYSIQYHVVWCVKYRRKVLTPKIEKSLITILRKIACENEFAMLLSVRKEDITEIVDGLVKLDHTTELILCK